MALSSVSISAVAFQVRRQLYRVLASIVQPAGIRIPLYSSSSMEKCGTPRDKIGSHLDSMSSIARRTATCHTPHSLFYKAVHEGQRVAVAEVGEPCPPHGSVYLFLAFPLSFGVEHHTQSEAREGVPVLCSPSLVKSDYYRVWPPTVSAAPGPIPLSYVIAYGCAWRPTDLQISDGQCSSEVALSLLSGSLLA